MNFAAAPPAKWRRRSMGASARQLASVRRLQQVGWVTADTYALTATLMHQLNDKLTGSIQVAWTNNTSSLGGPGLHAGRHPRRLAPNLLRQRHESRRVWIHEQPFRMTPDVRLFFPSTAHSRAYAHLLYGLSQREGFVVVTGEVGAGKTTLIERLCAEFSTKGHAMARVMTTQVEATELLRLVAIAFGAPAEGGKAELLQGIIAALRRGVAERGRRQILIVDEAQALPVASLGGAAHAFQRDRGRACTAAGAAARVSRSCATPWRGPISTSSASASSPPITFAALTREETHLYVRHRMTSVGWTGYPAWEETALDLVHEHSGGIPRRINRLCARVLLAGALEHAAVLTAELVSITAEELTQDLGAICAERRRSPHGSGGPRHRCAPSPSAWASWNAASEPPRTHAASACRSCGRSSPPWEAAHEPASQRHVRRCGGLVPGPGLRRHHPARQLGQRASDAWRRTPIACSTSSPPPTCAPPSSPWAGWPNDIRR